MIARDASATGLRDPRRMGAARSDRLLDVRQALRLRMGKILQFVTQDREVVRRVFLLAKVATIVCHRDGSGRIARRITSQDDEQTARGVRP
jgi:hypothetical protein